MKAAPILEEDVARVQSLRRMNLLSTPAEKDFDRIVRVAAEHFGMPVALFSLIDETRQWFKSRIGLGAAETARDISFCGHVIVGTEVFVVEDATKDNRFADNPLVIAEPHVEFYAGVPIANQAGHNIGTLCIIDHAPRRFTAAERDRLKDFGWWVQLAIDRRVLGESQTALAEELDEARRDSLIDPMTQTWNRRGFKDLAQREIARARRAGSSAAVAMIDIDHFKRINDSHGHAEGDRTLALAARVLRAELRNTDILARFGGEEFVVLMPDIGREDAARLAERLRAAVEREAATRTGDKVTVSVGAASFDAQTLAKPLDDMIHLADKALYDAKGAGRNCVVLAAG